jgi:hypothetical protein
MERIPVVAGHYLIKMSPEEIQDLNMGRKLAVKLGVKAASLISEAERQIGGVLHAVINENMPIEEAEARIKMIAELNSPDNSTEDR